MTLDIRRFQIGKFLEFIEDNFFAGTPVIGLMIFLTEEEIMADQITVPDDHADITATVQFVDSEGSPTTAENPVTWASDNSDAATVAASEDGMSATVHVGSPGAAIISVETTNNAGDTIRAQGTITVVPGDVALGTVDFGEV